MPLWLISVLLPMAEKIIITWGVPALEARFPKLAPLLEELLHAVSGGTPNPAVHVAAQAFQDCTGVACPANLK